MSNKLIDTKTLSYFKKKLDGTFATKQDIANAYIYKGSVGSFDLLPETASIGTVYNVETDGMNYAYTGNG